MIDSPTENVKLTFEQLQQIDVVEKRLSNLQSEIANANKILKGTKSECDRALKEKLYQEELAFNLASQIKELTTSRDNLAKEITLSTQALEDTKKTSKDLSESNYAKTDELLKREQKISQSETEHLLKVEDFNNKYNQLLDDKNAISTAKEAFLKAIETVTWK